MFTAQTASVEDDVIRPIPSPTASPSDVGIHRTGIEYHGQRRYAAVRRVGLVQKLLRQRQVGLGIVTAQGFQETTSSGTRRQCGQVGRHEAFVEGIFGFGEGRWEFLGQRRGWYLALVLRLAALRCVAGAGIAVLIAGSAVVVLMMMAVAVAVIMSSILAHNTDIFLVIFVCVIGCRGGERGCRRHRQCPR